MAVEQVNQDILKILGLDETDEIDMKSYKGFLREKLVEISMGKGGLSRDEELVVQSEFQRVKKSPNNVRVKKKKITAQNIGFKKKSSALVRQDKRPVLSRQIIQPQKEVQKEKKELQEDKRENKTNKNIGDTLKNINQTLSKILKSIVSRGENDKKRREKDRLSSEKRKAQERESGLEKPFQVLKNLAKKIIQPFQGILDTVFRFLGFTFLGWLVGRYEQIGKWIESNKGKINVVTRFLKDWWPALLGAYTLFFTPFGKLVRGTIRMVAGFTKQIIKHLAVNPAKYLIRHPVVAAGVATGLATYGAYKWKEGQEKKLVQQEASKRNVRPEVVQGELERSKRSPIGMFGEAFSNIGPMGYMGGGSISGLGKYFSGIVSKSTGKAVGGFGKDTQMFPIAGGGSAVLQPGETVLQVGARERMIKEEGVDPLAYNKGPNANKPTKFTFSGGGTVGYNSGGVVGGSPTTQNLIIGSQASRALLKGASLPSQGIRGRGLGGELRKGFHGTSKAAASSIRQANLYKDWQQRGLGFRSGSPQNYYFTKNAFFSPDYNVAQRFATEAATEKRGILQRAFSRGVRGTGEVLDVAAPMGSGSFLRIPGITEQVVKPQTLTKGMRLMEKINQGKYAKSAKAQQLMSKGYTTASLKGARGLGKAAGRFIPGVGIALGGADAALRTSQGDLPGAGMSLISMIPGPLGWGAMGLQGLYDMARSNPKSATYRPGGGRQELNRMRSKIKRKQSGGMVDPYSKGTSAFGEVPLIRAALAAGIRGPELAAFLSQMSHETGQFQWSRELGRGKGMGYSGGSRYHGRGYTQLTHDYNYKDFGQKLGVDLLKDPDILLRDPNLSARVAIEYWKQRVRPNVKNWNDVFAHSAAINLPSATSPSQIRGYDDRVKAFNYYSQNLNSIVSRSLPPKPKPKPKKSSMLDNIAEFFGGLFGKPKRKQGGGVRGFDNGHYGKVSTTSGFDIMGGLMGADTQFTALKPREYVIPSQVTDAIGEQNLDRMVAQYDRNSTPAKSSAKLSKPMGPKITYINLPDKITSKSTPSGNGINSLPSPNLPEFSVEMMSPWRTNVAEALGIRDLV